jgi:hypothetical protein
MTRDEAAKRDEKDFDACGLTIFEQEHQPKNG